MSILYKYFLKYPRISTDTRNIVPESLFFALRGSNFDGNRFAEQALAAGARYAIIDDVAYKKDGRYILVDNALESLQQLASFHRQQFKIPVLAITGTNGKTTTKELIDRVLSQKFRTLATKGNLNNHIGVPLTLLQLDKLTEVAIIEMGANHIGEIDFLCQIAQPTHGLITNVGKAHLEGFGSFDGVKQTKGELYSWLAEHNGTLFIQYDNEHLREMYRQRSFLETYTYGVNENNHVYGKIITHAPKLALCWHYKGIAYTSPSQLTGGYNVENILAAITVGIVFGVKPELINGAIASYEPKNNRSQLLKTEKNSLICDFYNANVSSMKAAVENLSMMKAGRKVCLLGDMFELGEESSIEHKHLVRQVRTSKFDRAIFVGSEFFKHRSFFPEAEFYEKTQELKAVLKGEHIKDSLVLLKASRGMAFENLLPFL